MGRADTGHSAGVDAVAPAISPDVEAGTESLWLVRRLGGQSLYVLAGNLFTLCVGLPLQIYVSRHLGSGGLGTFSLLEGVAATVAGLLGFGLAQTAVRFIPQYLEQGSYRAARRLIVRAFALLCVAGAAGYVVLLGASLAGWKAFGAPADVVAVMGAMIPLGLLAYFAQQCLRGFQEIRYLIIGSSFVQMTVKVLVTVIALALGARLLGYAVAVVAASFATFMWLGFGVLRRLRAVAHLSPKTDAPGRWIRFAAISYATSVVSLPASYLDRFLLGYFVGAGPVGVLAVAKQLQQLPLVIYQMLLSVSAPMLAAAHARGARSECDRIYALTTDWAVKAAIPLVLFLGLLAYPVLALFGHAFAEQGTPALRIFVVAQLVNLATGPNGSVATMCGLEKEAFRIDLTTTVGTALLMLLLVPLLGLVGASFAVLFNAVVHSLWLLRLVRNNLGIRWWHARYLEWLLPAVASAATAIALTCIVPRWNAPMLGVALCGMYLVFVSAVFVQGLNSDDRALLLHVVSRCKALIGMGDLSR